MDNEKIIEKKLIQFIRSPARHGKNKKKL